MSCEQSYIWHTTRDNSLHSRSLLLDGLTIARYELRCEDLGVIRRCDQIAVAGKVATKKRGPPPVMPARVGEHDQGIRSRLRYGVAYGHLASRCVA